MGTPRYAVRATALDTGIRRQPALVLGGIGTVSAFPASAVLGDVSTLMALSFEELTEALLDAVSPKLVLSPLAWSDWDVLDVANQLQDIGYAGTYCAITPRLPRPDLITQEVAAKAPKIDFKLLLEAAAMYAENPSARMS